MNDIKSDTCWDSQSSGAPAVSASAAVIIIVSAILPAGLIISRTMTWFPFMRRPFLDQTPLDVQLTNKIREHNESIKQTLSSTTSPVLKRHKSLIAMDRPAFDSSAELLTPPESESEECSPEKPKPKVLVPLNKRRSLPQLLPPEVSSERITAILKVELMHFLLSSLSQRSRIALSLFVMEMKMVTPHLVDYLLQLDSPVVGTMTTSVKPKEFLTQIMSQKLKSFADEFKSMVRVDDKSIFTIVTKEQLGIALCTTKSILSERLVQYIRSMVQEQLFRSMLVKDLHSDLSTAVPYAVSQMFLTIGVFRTFLQDNGFIVDENDVVRISSVTKTGTRPSQGYPRERNRLPGGGAVQRPAGLVRNKRKSEAGDKWEDATDGEVVKPHGSQCVCDNLDSIVKRLPTARLKKLLADRHECLVHHFILSNKKSGVTE